MRPGRNVETPVSPAVVHQESAEAKIGSLDGSDTRLMDLKRRGVAQARNPILFCVRDVGGFGGSSQSPLDWLHALGALGIHTTLVTRSSPEVLATPLPLDARIHWKTVEKPRKLDRTLRDRSFWWAKSRLLGPRAWLRRPVVIVEGRNGFKLGNQLGIVSRPSTALVVRGQPDQYAPELAGDDRLGRMQPTIAQCDCIIFNAHRVEEMWRSAVDLTGKRTLIVANTAQEDEVQRIRKRSRDEVRRELGLAPDAIVVLCLASIQLRKGQDLLLDVWPEVQAQAPNTQLHLVGPAAKRGRAEALVERARSTPGVFVTGARRDALSYLYASDLLVLPSRGESMPRVVLEAMALGTPVVATKAGAIPEMIRHGTSGMLFDAEDPGSAGEAIVALAHSEARRRAMAECALAD